MKILIVVPRREDSNKKDYYYIFPLGLAYISSVLKKERYDVDILNLNHRDGPIEDSIKFTLDKKEYDIICTGNITIGYWITKKIIDSVRKYSLRAKIILGGIIVISEPKTTFNLLNPDYAVIGEGEETIIDLLEAIKKNKDVKKVKGVLFRDDDQKIHFTGQREPPKNIDSLPFPDFEGFGFEEMLNNLHTNSIYLYNAFDNPRPYPILGSRGCPFNCTFCYHYSRYRKRSVKNIIKELNIAIKKYKINIIHFHDDCISADLGRLYDFCKQLKKIREKTPWEIKTTFSLTVHNVNKEMLKTLKGAGVNVVGYGFESFSPKILKSMRKPITPEMINNAFHETIEAGIGVQANFIFGDVAETKETIRETLNWWKKNSIGQINLGLISPYPGSEIYNHCLRKGIIKDKRDFIEDKISKVGYYNMSENLSLKEFEQLKKEILMNASKYYKQSTPISIKKQSKDVYEFKVKCPFCKKIIVYKNCLIQNKSLYDFSLTCRECNLHFFVLSPIMRIIYKNYSAYSFLNNYKSSIIKYLKEINLIKK